jgi:acyl carrier protein
MDEKRKDLERILGEFWDENEIPGEADPSSTAGLGVAMDSLTAVEVLVEVDKLYNKKIPVDSVIQRGGYKDKDEFVSRLAEQIEKVAKDGRK